MGQAKCRWVVGARANSLRRAPLQSRAPCGLQGSRPADAVAAVSRALRDTPPSRHPPGLPSQRYVTRHPSTPAPVTCPPPLRVAAGGPQGMSRTHRASWQGPSLCSHGTHLPRAWQSSSASQRPPIPSNLQVQYSCPEGSLGVAFTYTDRLHSQSSLRPINSSQPTALLRHCLLPHLPTECSQSLGGPGTAASAERWTSWTRQAALPAGCWAKGMGCGMLRPHTSSATRVEGAPRGRHGSSHTHRDSVYIAARLDRWLVSKCVRRWVKPGAI